MVHALDNKYLLNSEFENYKSLIDFISGYDSSIKITKQSISNTAFLPDPGAET